MDTNRLKSVPGGSASSRALFCRRVFLIAAFLVPILVGISFYSLQPREPVHAGKPLSYWLAQIESDPKHADDAVQATQAVGTNAIPWLLAELEAGSLWRYRVNQFLDRQELIKFRFSDPNERRNRARLGFFALGANGRTAIPSLIERIQSKPLPTAELYALAFTGNDAIPFLITNLTNEARIYVPAIAALAVATAVHLDRISVANAEVFVPVLTQMLQSTNPRTRAKADMVLNGIRSKAAEGSPNDIK